MLDTIRGIAGQFSGMDRRFDFRVNYPLQNELTEVSDRLGSG